MKPALAQVCSLPSSFAQDVEDYGAGECRAIEVWLTKLDMYLEQHDLRALRALLDAHGMQVPVASFQGGILSSQGEARREAWQLFERRLALCRDVGISTLVVAADVTEPIHPQVVDRVTFSLRQAVERAEAHGVRLALEFQASSTLVNNLETAAVLVAEIGHPSLGICLDAFHFQVGPSKLEDLRYLDARNLFHVQLCDLADVPREFAGDSHRILPGDGDLPIEAIVDYLRGISYEGYVSVEVMNPQLWQVPPRQFGEIAITALRRVLGQASME